MKATLLGTGTSSGIPVIGCECAVCASIDPRNKRRRTSLYVEAGGQHLLIDTTPDFREQALQYKLPRVDAVLFTHAHADHILGFDDIRRYNRMQGGVIPAYASATTMADVRRIFNYIGEEAEPGLYQPRIDFRDVSGAFQVGPVTVTPLPVKHGPEPADGYLFEHDGRSLGYVPDCKEMGDAIVRRLAGVDVMILDALRYHPHKTHLTVDQSAELLARIRAKQSFIIHMCHDLDHEEVQQVLPESIDVSYDGLVLDW